MFSLHFNSVSKKLQDSKLFKNSPKNNYFNKF